MVDMIFWRGIKWCGIVLIVVVVLIYVVFVNFDVFCELDGEIMEEVVFNDEDMMLINLVLFDLNERE